MPTYLITSHGYACQVDGFQLAPRGASKEWLEGWDGMRVRGEVSRLDEVDSFNEESSTRRSENALGPLEGIRGEIEGGGLRQDFCTGAKIQRSRFSEDGMRRRLQRKGQHQ
jgi:hypothetical protein